MCSIALYLARNKYQPLYLRFQAYILPLRLKQIELNQFKLCNDRLRGLLFQAFLLFCRLLITFDFVKELFINYLLSDGSNKVES